jgi:TPR repeat protein
MAAEQGYASAMSNLGGMYFAGKGVTQDYVMAHMWVNLAVSHHPPSEREIRDRAVKNRDLVASKMTPAQIAVAQRLAREWKPKKE